MNALDLAFDMETADPDDILTLSFVATHPRVRLRAVTITPGTRAQVGVVRWVLARVGVDGVPVGSKNPDHEKACVSEFHYKWLGEVPPAEPDDLGGNILASAFARYPELRLVTGASLGNVSAALRITSAPLTNIFIQGGFAGDSVVPEPFRLAKFEGRETCPTFNLNGDIPAAKNVLANAKILRRHLISKNVCHGVIYDQAMHERMMRVDAPTRGFALMRDGMAHYLQKHKAGKAFHDPLAACTAIEPSVCEMREVEVYRENGEWGSRLASGTETFIAVHEDRAAFERVLSAS